MTLMSQTTIQKSLAAKGSFRDSRAEEVPNNCVAVS